MFLLEKIKVKKRHAFHYQSLITGHFQAQKTYCNNPTFNSFLKIDSTLEETFQQNPELAFLRNRNLKDIIGGKKIEFN